MFFGIRNRFCKRNHILKAEGNCLMAWPTLFQYRLGNLRKVDMNPTPQWNAFFPQDLEFLGLASDKAP